MSEVGWRRVFSLCTACVLALLAAGALWIDMPLARWLREQPLPGDLHRLIDLAEVFAWGGTVAIIIASAATLDPRGWKIVPRLAASSLGAGLLADAVKLCIARLRPSAATLDTMTAVDTFVGWMPVIRRDTLPASYGYGLQSFPSAHAATAVGLALGLSVLYPRGRWLFGLLAVLACVQRLAAQAHYASDVLAGGALAYLLFACLEATCGCGEGEREVS